MFSKKKEPCTPIFPPSSTQLTTTSSGKKASPQRYDINFIALQATNSQEFPQNQTTPTVHANHKAQHLNPAKKAQSNFS